MKTTKTAGERTEKRGQVEKRNRDKFIKQMPQSISKGDREHVCLLG